MLVCVNLFVYLKKSSYISDWYLKKIFFKRSVVQVRKRVIKRLNQKTFLKAPKWNWIWQLGNIVENANFINVFPIFGYFFMVLSKGASVYQLQISYEKHDWYKLDINILMALSEGSNGNKFMKARSRLKGFFGIN